MPQEMQQWQSFCNRCQKHTLHQRLLNYPNHVLHLLVFLFCCGLWLPVWILITLVSAFERSPDFLCTQCGQAAGELTFEQAAAWEAERARQKAEARANRAAHREKMAESVAGGMATAGAFLGTVPGLLHQAGTLAISQGRELPGRIDKLLVTLIGKENDILLWFCRIVIAGATVALFLLLLFSLCRAALWLFGAT